MPPIHDPRSSKRGQQPQPKKTKPRRRFRLLAGQHIGPDLSAEPNPETGRYPSKTWNAGQVVLSETDLCKRFGDQKFQEVGSYSKLQTQGDVTDFNEEENPATFPAGQVSTGYPENMTPQGEPGGTEGRVPQTPEEMGEEGEDEEEQDTPSSKKGKSSKAQQDEEESSEKEPAPNFEQMLIRDLKKYAEEKGVDLSDCRNRADMIGKILSKGP